jgi:hypothetical protein
MASITISELRPAGSELFQDSESFLNELNDQEMLAIAGGVVRGGGNFRSLLTAFNTAGNTAANTNGNSLFNSIKVGC